MFRKAKPVWHHALIDEMHVYLGFRARLPELASQSILRIAAASLYRVFLNGKFFACGPARAPHGFAHVDEWKLPQIASDTWLAVEVLNYNINSYYLIQQTPFLQTEVCFGNKHVALHTEPEALNWDVFQLHSKRREVQRYSWMRAFLEIYELEEETNDWRTGGTVPSVPLSIDLAPERKTLPRYTELPNLGIITPASIVTLGETRPCELPKNPWRDRSLTEVGPQFLGYSHSQIREIPTLDLQRRTFHHTDTGEREVGPISLDAEEYIILDFKQNKTGYIGIEIVAPAEAHVYLIFDEVRNEQGDVDFKRWSSANVISLHLGKGSHQFESLEPYTLRYLKVVTTNSPVIVLTSYLRTLECPLQSVPSFESNRPSLDLIFRAAVETFRQNAIDIFMDCPGRERAGYLCDSFFMARAAWALMGKADIERSFLENYLLPEGFEHLPEGMVPMCYPADHWDGLYIPNWSMWLILQLEEFQTRTNDRSLIAAFEPRIDGILTFLAGYENEFELLEDLPGWVFVEWSEANEYTDCVSIPTNMLYMMCLEAASRLYGRPELAEKARRIKSSIMALSFDGTLFRDQAIRLEDKLIPANNYSEVCQYFAIFSGVARGGEYTSFRQLLADSFAPNSDANLLFPHVAKANAFIGYLLRLEFLSMAGRSRQVLNEIEELYTHQAQITGTIWETDTPIWSCNHGFGSYLCCLLLENSERFNSKAK